MKIKISKDLASYLGETKLRTIGIEWSSRSYSDGFEVDLSNLTAGQIVELHGWLEESAKLGVRGPKVLIRDIELWMQALKDAGTQKARTVNQFAFLLTEYLRKIPEHRVYQRLDIEGIAYVAYYVNTIVYHPESRRNNDYVPPSTEMELLYIELGGRVSKSVYFHSEDILGMTASESLIKKGFIPETLELRASYLNEAKLFNDISPRIGAQFLANGHGTDNLDGNPGGGWSRYSHGTFKLNNSKVVVDIFFEDEKERRSKDGYINQTFWAKKIPKALVASENEEELEENEATMDSDKKIVQIEIPIHPYCAVFDLRLHLRMRVHVNYLTEYEYDSSMSKKLVLPKITKDLIDTLISQSSTGFSDIIENKGKGVCILLGGAPGVGKTLTAEVFSESSKRPLYSIQAAQLGIKADQVEISITRFLARGTRWNAIVLIDEADVYIRARDRDMEHNAIVASILRVLEYQSSILFMTTNLANTVDDAIVSRCIARINYEYPTTIEQAEIWRILAGINNIKISEQNISESVKRHPRLAGRDIKQLLKLAVLHTAKNKELITPDVIDFVAQFQPTIR